MTWGKLAQLVITIKKLMELLAAFSCRVNRDADRLAFGRDAGASLEGSKRSKGRWTKEEHEHFLIGLRERGKDWEAIQRDFVPTRSVTQIRTHAQKFFRKTDQGLPFPYEPYISTGKSLAVYKPKPVSVDGDTAATTSTTGATTSDAVGAHANAAAATAFPTSEPHHLGFKREKGTNDAVPNVLPQAPQETLCSLPPLGLQSDLINHLTGMLYEDANNLGELANIQRLGEEWIGGSVDKDGDRGGIAGVSSAPAWSGPWAPSNFNIDGGGSSHHSAATFGRDEDSTGARLVPHSSESVLGIQEQQQQYLQHQQLPSVSWQGYAPGDSAGGGRSGSANY